MCVIMKIKGSVVQNMLETPTGQAIQQEANLKINLTLMLLRPLQILVLIATTLFKVDCCVVLK